MRIHPTQSFNIIGTGLHSFALGKSLWLKLLEKFINGINTRNVQTLHHHLQPSRHYAV